MTLTIQTPVYRGETCRGCGRELVFIQTEKGRREPLERQEWLYGPDGVSPQIAPASALRIVASLDGAPALSRSLKRCQELELVLSPTTVVHVSHFATCPERDRFRRSR